MFQAIKQYLDKKGLNYQVLSASGHRIFKMQLTGINGAMNCIVDVREKQVLVLTFCNTNTPQHKRQAMAELITRMNYSLLLGNFKMNFEDGEVRFSISWQYDDLQPVSESVIEHNFMTSAIMMDKFLPAIMSVNYSNTTPVKALQETEEAPLFSFN
jgi:hypothetical protein